MSQNRIGREDRLIPSIRAHLARRLVRDGLRVSEIASALNVTQPAVTQYLKGKRGKRERPDSFLDAIVDPLAEKIVKRLSAGQRTLEPLELMEAARQLMVLSSGGRETLRAEGRPHLKDQNVSLQILRER